ncbi:hypothetical protein JR316_0005759 [Psilocybe cubensis]|nr:hypothetical protein JR316_0005759 [Psilocybe cubensis]KAH9481237.1 hypothetical protein JR316_0005759 [Psilocybe cubensis]
MPSQQPQGSSNRNVSIIFKFCTPPASKKSSSSTFGMNFLPTNEPAPMTSQANSSLLYSQWPSPQDENLSVNYSQMSYQMDSTFDAYPANPMTPYAPAPQRCGFPTSRDGMPKYDGMGSMSQMDAGSFYQPLDSNFLFNVENSLPSSYSTYS